MPCIRIASTLPMVVVGTWAPVTGLVTRLVCEMIALLVLSSNSGQPDPAVVPFALDIQFAIEILLRRQVRIGEGRHAVDVMFW